MDKYLKNKKGQTILELAVCFPLMFMLMFFSFDASKVVVAKMDVTCMARDTMRAAGLQRPNVALEQAQNVFKLVKNKSEWAGIKYRLKSLKTGNKIGDEMESIVCADVPLYFPIIWGTDSGYKTVCQTYKMNRTIQVR